MPFDHEAAEAAGAARRSAQAVPAEGSMGPVARSRGVATPAGMLRLQRLAGNAAVQRAVEIEELQVTAQPPQNQPTGRGTAAGPTGGGTAAGMPSSATLGDGVVPASINAPVLDVNAPVVNFHSALVNADGIIRAPTIIADSIIASSYSPGAGNVM